MNKMFKKIKLCLIPKDVQRTDEITSNRKSQYNWFKHYIYNLERLFYPDLLDGISKNKELSSDSRNIITKAIVKLWNRDRQFNQALITRQEAITLINQLHNNPSKDIPGQLHLLSSSMNTLKELIAFDQHNSYEPALSSVIIECYQLATMLDIDLDKAVSEYIEKYSQIK